MKLYYGGNGDFRSAGEFHTQIGDEVRILE